MKRKVPKRNIALRIADVENPGNEKGFLVKEIASPREAINKEDAVEFFRDGKDQQERVGGDRSTSKRLFSLRKIFLLAVFLGIIVAGFFGFRIYRTWNNALTAVTKTGARFEYLLKKTDHQTPSPEKPLHNNTLFDISDFSKIKVLWESAGDAYKSFQEFSATGVDLVQQIDVLQNTVLDFVFQNRGQEFIDRLEKIKSDLEAMAEANKKLTSLNLGTEGFLPGSGGSRLSLQSDLGRFDNFLAAFIRWLKTDKEHHMLVLFENSSELRPGGGFLGSYADVSMQHGSVQKIEMHDINDADRELELKIIPPKPLQLIASRWRAADANWFFDNALSSQKIIQFMEASKKYRANLVTFDGAIAVSPKVVSDVLEIIGSVELPGRRLVITKDNFLTEIQKEVQMRQEQAKVPKKILEELAPIIVDAVTHLRGDSKKALLQKLGEWFAAKDAMLYSKDPELERFFDFYNLSGKVFELPNDFNGDYLAVVNANVGGGKTDLFIQQKIVFQSRLNLDGTASDHLTIQREHQGNRSDSWWYRLPSEDNLQVFTPLGASLSNFSGGWGRKIIPKVNYKTGYETDPVVAEIEQSAKSDFQYPLVNIFQESAKNVFAAWIKTNPGQTSKTVFDYPVRLFAPPARGQTYHFVFEKQAGSRGEYQFELYAPVGFRWQENGLPVFEYKTSDPPGRLMFNLTLNKD